ncbi:sporulation membrane protein YtrI [Bacillus alveayuensis]|uniref:sporulation membrane protein YtrI n=1 Tax=Aeribacillus alveayuensis TaxID=279215 RepID=UPI0005D13084|nr:sporulation membrane protein YtrI [Bacillus alveayuensis]
MRIPPYHRDKTWQRFFAGMAVGAVISWLVFLQLFGILQEKQVRQIAKLKETIVDLQNDIQIWQQDYIQLNKENKKKLTIQDIKINIINAEQYKLDSYTKFRIEENIRNDIDDLIAKDIETVYKNKELLKKTIENKTFEIDDRRYKVEISELFLFTTLSIQLKIKQGV